MLLASLTLISMLATPADAPMSLAPSHGDAAAQSLVEAFCSAPVVFTASVAPAPHEGSLDWCTDRDGVNDPRCTTSAPFGAPTSDPRPSAPGVDLYATLAHADALAATASIDFADPRFTLPDGTRSRIDRPPA